MLGRASVIAHETSHMWFGDLVTMRWFNDVWMKEVFANFMAAKIVNPSFPEDQPRAAVPGRELPGRVSRGPHRAARIRSARSSTTCNEAGSLYGAIIYQKAPIVMRQLERLIGEEQMRDGLRAYLKQFQFGNATWLDLVRVLDERTRSRPRGLEPGLGRRGGPADDRTDLRLDADRIGSPQLAFVQRDPSTARGLRWTEQIAGWSAATAHASFAARSLSGDAHRRADGARGLPRRASCCRPAAASPTAAFDLDVRSRAYLLQRVAELADPVTRGAAWVTLWEEMLERRVPPAAFVDAGAARRCRAKTTEQNVQLMLGYLDERVLEVPARPIDAAPGAGLERLLRDGHRPRRRSSSAEVHVLRGVPLSGHDAGRRRASSSASGAAGEDSRADAGRAGRGRAWRSSSPCGRLPNAAAILEEQRGRFTNPDRKARFEFVMPALSADAATRDAFFVACATSKNRRREPWVIEGLSYLNHPLRADHAREVHPAEPRAAA